MDSRQDNDFLRPNEYETGIKVSDEQIDEIRLRRHKVHQRNRAISPRPRK
jgi:hypothetical protein